MDAHYLQFIGVVIVGLSLLLGGLILWNKIKASQDILKEEMEGLRMHINRREETISEQRQSLKELAKEKQYLSTVLLVLPDLAKELSSTIVLKDIEYIIMKIPKHLFDARYVLFHYLEGDKLILKGQLGLCDEETENYKEIRLGEGRIGFAARKQIVMTADDFDSESRLIKERALKNSMERLKIDICAPMIHHSKIYGAISIGEITKKKEDVKVLMSMIANLGAIAIENALLFDEIQKQSDIDRITGLFNLTYFYKYLDRELKKSARFNRPLAVLVFDIDYLRRYNELFGHLEGENVIRIIGSIIKDSLRTVDIPCRYGGEEYGLILPETDRDKALMVGERIRREVEEYPFSLKRVTISGGLATYPENGNDVNLLLKEAELNLSKAKAAGRNKVITA